MLTTQEKNRVYQKEYATKYPEKVKARVETVCAIRSGRIVRQPCDICGNLKAEAHHLDYSKPSEIRWMCRKHHREYHQGIRKPILNIANILPCGHNVICAVSSGEGTHYCSQCEIEARTVA